MKALVQDRAAAKEYVVSFLQDEDRKVRMVGLKLAAILRDPELFPLVKRLFVAQDDETRRAMSHPGITEPRLAMEQATEVDRYAALDDFILFQEVWWANTPDYAHRRAERDQGRRAPAMDVLRKEYHETVIAVPDPKTGSVLLLNALVQGYPRWLIGGRVEELLKQKKISRKTAEHTWIEFGDERMKEKMRDRFLLLVGLAETLGIDEFSLVLGCVNYFIRLGDDEAWAWLMVALRRPEVRGRGVLTERIGEALKALLGYDEAVEDPVGFEAHLVRKYPSVRGVLEKAEARMAELVKRKKAELRVFEPSRFDER